MKGECKMELKKGYTLEIEELENAGCNNGNYPSYTVKDQNGTIVAQGVSCRCGRGCSETDCVVDDWGYYDTAIEKYREKEVSPDAQELATKIRCSQLWDGEQLAQLCAMAGMESEWKAADGETFEQVAYAAAEKLGVEI
jgi:hypothetical protein